MGKQMSWRSSPEHDPQGALFTPTSNISPVALSISHFQPNPTNKQERCGISHYLLLLPTLLQGVGQAMTPLPAADHQHSHQPCLAMAHRASHKQTSMRFIWTLGKQELNKTIKVVLKKFSRFYPFSHSLQFSFLAFEKWPTAVLWITAVTSGSRQRRPKARLG